LVTTIVVDFKTKQPKVLAKMLQKALDKIGIPEDTAPEFYGIKYKSVDSLAKAVITSKDVYHTCFSVSYYEALNDCTVLLWSNRSCVDEHVRVMREILPDYRYIK
jgi:hypothetical protein